MTAPALNFILLTNCYAHLQTTSKYYMDGQCHTSSNPVSRTISILKGEKSYKMGLLSLFYLVLLHNNPFRYMCYFTTTASIFPLVKIENANNKMLTKEILERLLVLCFG